MMLRQHKAKRKTGETAIELTVNLDGSGLCKCETGLGFLDHMLQLMTFHAGLDLTLNAKGDLQVDDHHLVEDVGILLGKTLCSALGQKEGIARYGWTILPMDEVLVAVAVDLSGRYVYCSNYQPVREKVGDLSTEMVDHFFRSLACESRMTLHLQFLNSGHNEHHRVEALFKGFGQALRMAVSRDPHSARIPSTKGVL